MSNDIICRAKFVFWDFDGVIKESVEVKSDAFEELFLTFGEELATRVRSHHEENGGVSRFEKLPLYLTWSGKEASTQLVDEYEKKFSLLVEQRVIDSLWVKGVLDYLTNNAKRQCFFLVSATPQKEIESILFKLGILDLFKQVVGSPTGKDKAIQEFIGRYNINRQHAVVIGDSFSDFDAARKNNLNFVLRKTTLNKRLQKEINCTKIEDFMEV